MIPLFDWPAQRPKCFKNCVTKNPKLFQDTPDLAEDFDSPICLACTTAKIVLIFKNVIPCSWQRYCFWQGLFWSLSKRKRKILHYAMLHFLVMLCYILSCFSWHILLQGQEFQLYNCFLTFWGKKWNLLFIYHYSLLLFTVTIHLLLFMTLFTPNFCLFKGGCPLYFKQVFSVLSSGLLS